MESENIKKLFSSYYDTSKKCADEVIKRLKDEDQKSLLEKLETAVRQVSEYENQMRNESHALDDIEHDINENADGSEWDDLSEVLKEKLAQSKSSITWTGGLKDYQLHVTKVLEGLELEDMIVAASETNIDPYTKQPIQHPVRTKYCNHAFDKTSVMKILKGHSGPVRCPYMGCNKRFTAKDLVDMKESDAEEDSD